jgi:hypothetical protein
MSGKERIQRLVLRIVLRALGPMVNRAAKRHAQFRAQLDRHDAVIQIQLRDGSICRHFTVRGGKLHAHAGMAERPDVVMSFKDVATALAMLNPDPDMGTVVHAAKNFKVVVMGPDHLATWWMQTLNAMAKSGLQFGTPMPDGTHRYTNLTNGGPLFVYVRDARIVRVTPIEYDSQDARPGPYGRGDGSSRRGASDWWRRTPCRSSRRPTRQIV